MNASNVSAQARAALVCLIVLMLAACNGSSRDSGETSIGAMAGSYQGVFLDDNGDPQYAMAVLVDPKRLTLAILDEEDHPQTVQGTYEAKTEKVSFSDVANCQLQDSSLACDMDGQSVLLRGLDPEPLGYPVADLAGRYNLLLDEQVVPLTVEAKGRFSVKSDRCGLAGQLEPVLGGSMLSVRVTETSCGDALAFGFVETETLYGQRDALVAYLPDSSLAGHWIR